jgi:hypothetical protein
MVVAGAQIPSEIVRRPFFTSTRQYTPFEVTFRVIPASPAGKKAQSVGGFRVSPFGPVNSLRAPGFTMRIFGFIDLYKTSYLTSHGAT